MTSLLLEQELADCKEARSRSRQLYNSLLDSNEKLSTRDFSTITRVEVIDKTGRAYVNRETHSLELSLQDNNRTLKLFLN